MQKKYSYQNILKILLNKMSLTIIVVIVKLSRERFFTLGNGKYHNYNIFLDIVNLI